MQEISCYLADNSRKNANTTTATAKAKKEKPTAAKTTHGKKVKVVFSDPVVSSTFLCEHALIIPTGI